MSKSSEDTRNKIIGLGDSSIKKSYYPLLQRKIKDLEEKQGQLMEFVRNLEERETELEKMLEEKNVLLAEVNHRVKNNFQIILSLLNIGEERTDTSDFRQLSSAKRRIEIMALVYQEFLFSDNYSEVTFCSFLKEISWEIRSELEMTDVEVIFKFPIDEVLLDLDIAISLAMISYEGIVSAFKSALEMKADKIEISLLTGEIYEGSYKYKLGFSPFSIDSELHKSQFIDALIEHISGKTSLESVKSGFDFSIYFNK